MIMSLVKPFVVSNKELDIRHGDDSKVEPVSSFAQERDLVQDEPMGQNLHLKLVTANFN